MHKILVVDDDKEIASLISDALMDEGFETLQAYDGEEAINTVSNRKGFDLIILDIMMPKADGLEVCRRIREMVSCPIIFVTAKNRVYDTLLGLEMGGDDYITKPFVVEELVARVKAHLRREQRSSKVQNNVIQVGQIEIIKESYEVYLNNEPVILSTREFQLLLYLCENAGKVLSKEQIFVAVWGDEYGDIGAVAVNVKNLRDKLDKNHHYIKTIWGVGYKLVKNIEDRL
jgi:DNA-binding response OmpR family regulator